MNIATFTKYNARWLAAGGLLAFSSAFGQTFFISLFAGEIMAQFQLSHGEWGTIYGIGTLASAAVMLWAGGLSDHYRAKTIGIFVLVLLAGACLAMAGARAAWVLPFVIFALRFTGQGMLSHIAVVAIARWFSAARGKALAISSLGYSFGEATLPLLFVSLLTVFHWQTLWILAAAIVLLAIPALLVLLKTERTPQSIAKQTEHSGMHQRQWNRGATLKHWLFWVMVPSMTAPSIFSTSLFFQQVHLTSTKGWAHADFVAMLPMYTLVTIGSALLFGLAIDRWGSAKLMALYQVPMALAFLAFGLGESIWMAAVGFALMGVMHGGGITLTGAFWPEFYGTRHLGGIKAIATALMVLGSAIGPALTGRLIDQGIIFADQMVAYAIYILLVCVVTHFAMVRAGASLQRPGQAGPKNDGVAS